MALLGSIQPSLGCSIVNIADTSVDVTKHMQRSIVSSNHSKLDRDEV